MKQKSSSVVGTASVGNDRRTVPEGTLGVRSSEAKASSRRVTVRQFAEKNLADGEVAVLACVETPDQPAYGLYHWPGLGYAIAVAIGYGHDGDDTTTKWAVSKDSLLFPDADIVEAIRAAYYRYYKPESDEEDVRMRSTIRLHPTLAAYQI